MLVFNIKLRGNKTIINCRTSAVTIALFIRNLGTEFFLSPLAVFKGVCL